MFGCQLVIRLHHLHILWEVKLLCINHKFTLKHVVKFGVNLVCTQLEFSKRIRIVNLITTQLKLKSQYNQIFVIYFKKKE